MKRITVLSSVATCALLLFGLVHPAPGQALELLSNSGFEEGTAHWTVKPGTAIFDIVTAPVHSGSQAALLTRIGASGYALIQQEVPVSAGQYYVVGGWALWNDPSLTSVSLRLGWLDGPGGAEIGRLEVQVSDRSPDWQLVSMGPLPAPAGVFPRYEAPAE